MGKRRREQKPAAADVYEAEEEIAEEEQLKTRRFDSVDNFQYELPEDFKDEEIDEDEAFTPEDETLFAHMVKPKPTDEPDGLGVDQQAEEGQLTRDDFSDDDSEADRLYGKPGHGHAAKLQERAKRRKASAVDEIFADVSDSDASSAESDEDSSDRAADPDGVGKAVRDVLGPRRDGRRRSIELQDEAAPESEFSLPPAGSKGSLKLADLVAALGPQRGRASKAHKQLNRLAGKGLSAVPAPLPRPIRARKERLAGYEATTKDVGKWTPIVRANREAPTLVFAPSGGEVPRKTTTAALTEHLAPRGGLEAGVAELLRAAGVDDEQAAGEAEEALALKAATAEEVAQRREELAKMRSLMFRHELKARHLAKIKSKDYHRRSNKAARHKAAKAGAVDDEDFLRLEAEKAEYERAKERLTLKHKNTSKWARRALKRGVNLKGDGTREAIAEQLRLGEELRRRVERMDPVRASDSEASDASSASSSESEGGNEGRRSAKAGEKARAAATAILAGDEADAEAGSGLFALPFMKRAQERRKAAAEQDARRLLEELEGSPASDGEPEALQGRRNFGLADGVQANNAAPDFEEESASGSDADEDAEAKLERLRRAAGKSSARSVDSLATSGPAKLRDGGGTEPKPHVQKPRAVVARVPAAAAPAGRSGGVDGGGSSVLQHVASQQGSLEARSALLIARGDRSTRLTAPRRVPAAVSIGPPGAVSGAVEGDIGAVADCPMSDAEAEPRQPRASVTVAQPAILDGIDEPPADEMPEEAEAGRGLTQQQLIAQAFAGDDVTAEFEAAKADELAAELPEIEAPSLLPGWGAWASQQREPRWMADARSKAVQQKEAARAKRQDAKLKSVIISERWDKRAAKYTSTSLPFPFSSKEALEGSMRHPLGSQYNTDASFRALTRPAVVKRSGVVIRPLKFSAAVADDRRAVLKSSQSRRQTVQAVANGMPQFSKKPKRKQAAEA